MGYGGDASYVAGSNYVLEVASYNYAFPVVGTVATFTASPVSDYAWRFTWYGVTTFTNYGISVLLTNDSSLARDYTFTTLSPNGTIRSVTNITVMPFTGNVVTVSNATLSLSLNNGASSLSAGNVRLVDSTVLNLNFGSATGPTGNPAINASGYAVSNTGTNIINITGQYLTVGQYPLIYTGASVPTNNFVLGTKPTGVVAVLTNSGDRKSTRLNSSH